MTWFCGGRQKHHNKSKVSNVQYSRDDIDNTAAVNNARLFAVVLQNFEASMPDELTVTRGQVVEKLYQDGDWVYVRNFDLRCGYIPLNFCYGMNQVINGGGQDWNANEVQGSTSRVESPQTRPHPKSINLGTFIRHSGSQSSVEVHNIEPHPVTPQQQANSVVVASPSQQQQVQPLQSSTPVTRVQSTHRLETPDSTPPMARSTRRLSSLQPSVEHVATDGAESAILEEPRYIERPQNNTLATAEGTVAMATATVSSNRSRPPRVPVRRSLSMNDGARLSCRSNVIPLVQRTDPIQRSISYQEAVRNAGQDPYRLVARNNRTHREPSLNPRLQYQAGHMTPPQRASPLNPRRQQSHMSQHSTQCNCNCERGQGAADFDPTDDVFLPEPKKPVGIYRCLQAYRSKYQGELSIKEGELVILLEFGRGDWAWVLTSMNQEGLLPRQYLVRYNPRLGVGGPGTGTRRKSSSNAATQTELVIEGCVRHVSGASSASAGATAYSASSSSSMTTPQATPPLTQRSKRLRTRTTRTNTRAKEVSSREGEGRCVVASAATQAKEPSPQWFENVDSLERPPRPTQLSCSVQTTPPLKHRRRPNTINTATPQSVKSADCCYLDNRSPNPAVLVTPKPVKSADYAGPASAEFWFNSLSSTTSSVHQTPTLTAMKDYNPPPNAKNCLRLSKGDALNAQPHMHYSKGWMWVWHTTQRSFGYVPQSHVGYTYPVNKGERSRKNTVEDAV